MADVGSSASAIVTAVAAPSARGAFWTNFIKATDVRVSASGLKRAVAAAQLAGHLLLARWLSYLTGSRNHLHYSCR